MKTIQRPPEPPTLLAFRSATPDASWNDARAARISEDVFLALARAQGYLCAYCEIDIEPGPFGQVDHFVPKSLANADQRLHLDFQNMLAVCEGGARPDLEGLKPGRSLPPVRATSHCGQRKGEVSPRGRVLDPAAEIPASARLWSVDELTGGITVDAIACAAEGVDPALAGATIETLGLDLPGLRRMRRAVIDALDDAWLVAIRALDDPDDADWARERILVAADHLLPGEDGRLLPFWTTVRSWAGPEIEPFIAGHAGQIPGLLAQRGAHS
ncbi:MAG TPA: hypothetical protein PKA64_07420 [Myxococcota bacterium]|nr:hypothetical protein [Myxococcota bacterium]